MKWRGIVRLAAIVLSVQCGASAVAQERNGSIGGNVWERDTGRALEGAHVVALEYGIFPVAAATAGERGAFVLPLPPGTYDVRATSIETGHVAAVRRDVVVATGSAVDVALELSPIARALEERGIEAEALADADGDFVPDRLEADARLDASKADTDEDGVLDGIAVWLGVGAGERSSARPTILSPPPASQLALTPGVATPPVPLVFATVPGATGYWVDVQKEKIDTVLDQQSFDFESGALVVGEGTALVWTPPAGLRSGKYRLRVQGYDLESKPIGESASVPFETVEHLAEELEITEDTELSGLVVASSIWIRSGVTVTVPAEGLCLAATADIAIEEGATLLGEPGAGVRLVASGNVWIHGNVLSGPGQAGADVTSDGRRALEEGRGHGGGEIAIVARGTVAIARTGRVASGDGGRGGSADGAQAAGDGGAGGRLALFASELLVADRPDRIHVGTGGVGGDGPLPGVGGESGDVWLSDWDLRDDRFVPLADMDFPVHGGIAGAPGSPRLGTTKSLDHLPPRGRKARRGWLVAGTGQPITARGRAGSGHGRGGHATAHAGEGGDVARPGLGRAAFGLTFGYVAIAGRGGDASATAGDGGTGGANGTPGWGGDALATGGEGGRALASALVLAQSGGDGGGAYAQGGSGQEGVDRCVPKPRAGGPGSDGGSAESTAGRGGAGTLFGGRGGDASARGGVGGPGGDGSPSGRGGRGGSSRAVAGSSGSGRWRVGQHGSASDVRGARGSRGGSCGRSGG